MKQTSKLIAVVITAFSATLLSCTKEQSLPNANFETPSAALERGGTVIDLGPISIMPKLVKHGQVNLAYTQTSNLATVQYTQKDVNQYSIINQQGKKTHIVDQYYNGAQIQRWTYELNSNSLAAGVKLEKLNNGSWSFLFSETYTYNASKQLIKTTDGSAHTDVAYDANGDVSSIKFYNWKNALVHETYFWYTAGNSPLINDKNGINPDDLWLDSYLKIFGKFRKHLPVRIKYSNYLQGGAKTDFTFSYALDANGLITTQKKYNTGSNVLIETTNFNYK